VSIYSRPTVVFQLILFSILSPYFIHLASALQSGSSALVLDFLVQFVRTHVPFIVGSIICVYATWKMSIIARYIAIILSVSTLVFTMNIALVDFNKVILVMCFFYAVTAYYLIMVYKEETSSAAYNPLYSANTIGRRTDYDLQCSIKFPGETLSGELTNWDQSGCFISLDPGEAALLDMQGELEIEIKLDGVIFKESAKVVSFYERGIGIRFTPKANAIRDGYNWEDYFNIVDHRGFFPRSRKC
tara:strand:- start:1774 stop:2505 length:732 start_codon:yes stop_codon:yes gene_type:complete